MGLFLHTNRRSDRRADAGTIAFRRHQLGSKAKRAPLMGRSPNRSTSHTPHITSPINERNLRIHEQLNSPPFVPQYEPPIPLGGRPEGDGEQDDDSESFGDEDEYQDSGEEDGEEEFEDSPGPLLYGKELKRSLKASGEQPKKRRKAGFSKSVIFSCF